MIGVSACLIGHITTYKNTHNLTEKLLTIDPSLFISVCPEVMGGLSIPRPPAEIIKETPLKVVNNQGVDVTKEYTEGSNKALSIFLENNVKVAILKNNSPSCGNNGIYDGTFTSTLVDGQGTFARLLDKHGIKVFSEKQLDEFFEYIEKNNII